MLDGGKLWVFHMERQWISMFSTLIKYSAESLSWSNKVEGIK